MTLKKGTSSMKTVYDIFHDLTEALHNITKTLHKQFGCYAFVQLFPSVLVKLFSSGSENYSAIGYKNTYKKNNCVDKDIFVFASLVVNSRSKYHYYCKTDCGNCCQYWKDVKQ